MRATPMIHVELTYEEAMLLKEELQGVVDDASPTAPGMENLIRLLNLLEEAQQAMKEANR